MARYWLHSPGHRPFLITAEGCRRKVLLVAKFRGLQTGVNSSEFTPNLASSFRKRYMYQSWTDVPEIRWEDDFSICNWSGTMHPISTSVNIKNEEGHFSMCIKISSQLSKVNTCSYWFLFLFCFCFCFCFLGGPYDCVSLRVMCCILSRDSDGLVLYRANTKTKQSNCMQYLVCLELHTNMLFYSF